jgi:hypothetical protein
MLVNDPSFATYDPRMGVTTSIPYPQLNQPTLHVSSVMGMTGMSNVPFYNSYPASYTRKQSLERELYSLGLHSQDLHLNEFGSNYLLAPGTSPVPIPATAGSSTTPFFFHGPYATFAGSGISELFSVAPQSITAQDTRLDFLLTSLGTPGEQSTESEPTTPRTPGVISDDGTSSSPSESTCDSSPVLSTPLLESLPVSMIIFASS